MSKKIVIIALFLTSVLSENLRKVEETFPNGGSWYTLNPESAFNAGFNSRDYNNGACNGGWKDAKFMQAPYIEKSGNSITARNTGEAV